MEEEILISYRGVNIDQKEYNILSDIDFDIRKGEFVYLIGKVGSGKSSFLKTIYGELNISQGEARVLDKNMRTIKPKEIAGLRRKLGIIFQDFQLLTDRNVFDNLEFVLQATGWKKKNEIESRIFEVLKLVGMENKGYKMPNELSGGTAAHRDCPCHTEQPGSDTGRRADRKPGCGDRKTHRTAVAGHLQTRGSHHHDHPQSQPAEGVSRNHLPVPRTPHDPGRVD